MSNFEKIVNYNNSGLTLYVITTECVKLSTAMKRMIKKYPELSGVYDSIISSYEYYQGNFNECDDTTTHGDKQTPTYRYIWHICIIRTEEQSTEQTEDCKNCIWYICIIRTEEQSTEYTDTDTSSVEIENHYTGGFVGNAKETINNIYGITKSNYNGVAYPEKEDCKTCVWRSDCKYKLTYQFNDTCEMYQPTSLYL